MSLRTRLVLAAAYLLAVVVLALEVPLALNIEHRATSEFEASVLGHAAVVGSRISDDVARIPVVAGLTPVASATVVQIVDETARTVAARIVVVDRLGRVLVDSSGEAAPGALYETPLRPEFGVAIQGGRIDIRRRFSRTVGQELVLVTVPIVHNGAAIGAVRVSERLGNIMARVHRSWIGLGLIGAVVVAVGLALAWLLATSLARSVHRLGEAAIRFGSGDLAARAPPEGPAEVAALGRSFNHMADQLTANLAAQRDFVANASHQLRTPLTGLKLRLEAIEEEGGAAAAEAGKAQAEVDRLSDLVDDLLQLTRATSGDAEGSAVDLVEAARRAVERWSGPAEAAGKMLRADADGALRIWASAEDLGHVLDNLIENALRYSEPGAPVTVRVRRGGGRTLLAVEDTGPGIPTQERERVFERFFRGGSGRHAGPGTGLGLAIVAELVHRWGGEVRLGDGPGTRIEAAFPTPPAVS